MSAEPSFFGIYRGVVVDNTDPDKRKRLRLRVPSVLDTAVTDWAWPCLPPSVPHVVTLSATVVGTFGSHTHNASDSGDNWAHKHVPAIGAQVWVMFEGGNQDYPVWVGVSS